MGKQNKKLTSRREVYNTRKRKLDLSTSEDKNNEKDGGKNGTQGQLVHPKQQLSVTTRQQNGLLSANNDKTMNKKQKLTKLQGKESNVITSEDVNNNATCIGKDKRYETIRKRTLSNSRKEIKQANLKDKLPEFIQGDGVNLDVSVEGSNPSDSDDEVNRSDSDDVLDSVSDLDEELDYVDDVESQDQERPTTGSEVQFRTPDSQGGSSSRELTAADMMKNMMENPQLRQIFNEMIDERVKDKTQKNQKSNSDKETGRKGLNKERVNNIVKSPSDTTIYAPALKLTPNKLLTADGNVQLPVHQNVNNQMGMPIMMQRNEMAVNEQIAVNNHQNPEQMIQNISNFVDNIRLENEGTEDIRRVRQASPQPGTSQQWNDSDDKLQHKNYTNDKMRDAGKRADAMVIEAEKYKASIENKAAGKQYKDSSDDEFFHLTCHVDQNLREKIERGEYVDLEKLLPKDRFKKPQNDRMELIYRDGAAFFQSSHENKISNVRKWEQAFRIYAAIYSMANPNRSAEIWQYIYVINSASSMYIWENVANYDYTFRQLMSQYPERSWAKCYLQMWNLTMRDTIPSKINNSFQGNHNSHNFGRQNNSPSATQNKSDYCWSFNKGQCKWGLKNCRFINRCSFCDSPTHGVNSCRKKKDRKDQPQQQHQQQNKSAKV